MVKIFPDRYIFLWEALKHIEYLPIGKQSHATLLIFQYFPERE